MVLYLDLDGTIIEVRRRHYLLCRRLVTDMAGVEIPLSESEFWNKKREGFSDTAIIESLGIDLDREAYRAKKIEYAESSFLLLEDRLFDSSLEALNKMFQLAELVLVTQRTNRDNTLKQIQDLSLAGFFGKIITSTKKSSSKFDLLACEIRNREAEKQVLIGDTEVDFDTAKKLSIDSMLVETGIRSRRYLDKTCKTSAIYKDLLHCATVLEKNLINENSHSGQSGRRSQ